jgi:transcriptional regulator of arginine metabolism
VDYLRRVDLVLRLLIIRTDPGQAQPLAFAIDRVVWSEIVGTVAGDDTILVISRTERSARMLERRLEQLAKGQ